MCTDLSSPVAPGIIEVNTEPTSAGLASFDKSFNHSVACEEVELNGIVWNDVTEPCFYEHKDTALSYSLQRRVKQSNVIHLII